MFLKAGALSLALLLASRLLGLVRESAVAAAFGHSALADLAVLMLSLPDWLGAVLASGALAYVLVPAWAGHAAQAVRRSQKRLGGALLVLGLALAMLLWLLRVQVATVLAPGLPPALLDTAATALAWSAASIPLALLAALGSARLQQGRDFLGLYGANLVVNVVVIGAIVGAALQVSDAVMLLGVGLLLAMAARLGWQRMRERRLPAGTETLHSDPQLPRPSLWAWAALSAGLPLALPFAARSLASSGGEGALAVFHYAWKLVELPLLLAVQLVATLALPAVAAALSQGLQSPAARAPLRHAFGLAWALACACAAGLLVGADAVAALLFGWGRMTPEALQQVAAWARVGAWGLLPQALTAVGLTVLASQRRMAISAWLFALALVGVLGAGWVGFKDGGSLMWALNLAYALVAVGVMATLGRAVLACLPWPTLALSLLALLGAALWSPASGSQPLAAGLAAAVVAALLVLAAGWAGWRRPR